MTHEAGGGDDDPRSNVLMLVPGFRNDEDVACGRALDAVSDGRVRAVFVACGKSPASRLAVWDEYVPTEAVERVVVNVEMLTRSANASGGTDESREPTRIETVADPADLAEIGATIDGALGDPDAPTDSVLCFHSVTDLVQQLDARNVFTFLEGLTSTVEQADAIAHYHMDPTVHDPGTIRTIKGLFDATFDVREEC